MNTDKTIYAAAFNKNNIKMLVEAGAEVDIWSQSVTALSLAAINRHRDVYDYLYPLTSEEIRQHCNEAVDFN